MPITASKIARPTEHVGMMESVPTCVHQPDFGPRMSPVMMLTQSKPCLILTRTVGIEIDV